MPRQKYLNEAEKSVINALKAEGFSNRAIGSKIHRSSTVVDNFLKKGANYGKKARTKGNSKITNRQKNQLIKLASSGNYTSMQLVNELQLPIKKTRACAIIKESGKLEYVKKSKLLF